MQHLIWVCTVCLCTPFRVSPQQWVKLVVASKCRATSCPEFSRLVRKNYSQCGIIFLCLEKHFLEIGHSVDVKFSSMLNITVRLEPNSEVTNLFFFHAHLSWAWKLPLLLSKYLSIFTELSLKKSFMTWGPSFQETWLIYSVRENNTCSLSCQLWDH